MFQLYREGLQNQFLIKRNVLIVQRLRCFAGSNNHSFSKQKFYDKIAKEKVNVFMKE